MTFKEDLCARATGDAEAISYDDDGVLDASWETIAEISPPSFIDPILIFNSTLKMMFLQLFMISSAGTSVT
jgi:hypothetical protein